MTTWGKLWVMSNSNCGYSMGQFIATGSRGRKLFIFIATRWEDEIFQGFSFKCTSKRLFDLPAGSKSRIECVPQTITKKIEAQNSDHDRQSRKENQVRRCEDLIAL